MFTKAGEPNTLYSVRVLRHDLLLNFSEKCLFEGTDRTFDQIYVENPYPIHKPFNVVRTDPVKQLLQEKQEYKKLLDVKRRRYKFDKRDISNQKIAGHEYMYLPRHLLEFYKNKDPDVFFNCDYNFYYTGGFLESLSIDNNDYFIIPDIKCNLHFINVRNPEEFVKLGGNVQSDIFNIRAVNSGGRNLIVTRGKCFVNIINVKNVDTIETIWTHKSEIPVLDARLNHLESNRVGLINSNLKLKIKDVETGKIVMNYKNKSNAKTDNFQQFQFLDSNTVALMDRFEIKLIDLRTKSSEQVCTPNLLECNSLCCFKIMNDDIFLASRHYLVKSDLRELTDFSYFSHTLNSPPCYMDLTINNDDCYLCLATQDHEKVLFTGKSVFSLPYKVPNIKTTFKDCCLNTPSFVLHDKLEDRLNLSTTGLKVFGLDNEIYIYWSNSLGEIFRQKISEEECGAAKPMEMLTDWINSLEKEQPVLHLTRVEDMSKARLALNSVPIEENLKRFKHEASTQMFLRKYNPQFSKAQVTGKIARDFLAIWTDDEDEGDVEDSVDDEPEVQEKVNNWIETNDFSDNENSLGFLNTSNL